jgi:hypothetical protein
VLLLVTLALVVASAVLLILGFVQDALGYIYLSMLCAGVAALALFVFARLARRRSAVLAGAAVAGGSALPYMAGVGSDEAPVRAARPTETSSRRGGGFADVMSDEEEDEDDGMVVATARSAGPALATSAEDPWAGDDAGADDWGDEVMFPIEDYDDLRVAEILPLLGQLEPEELQDVRDRELAGKARATILDRIDDRLGRSGDPATTTASLPVVPVAPVATPEPGASTAQVKSLPVASGVKKTAGRSAKAPGPKAASTKAAGPKAAVAKAAVAKTAVAKVAGAKAPARKAPGEVSASAASAPSKRGAAAKKPAGPAAAAAQKADPATQVAPVEQAAPAKKAAPGKKAAVSKAAVPTKRAARKAQ